MRGSRAPVVQLSARVAGSPAEVFPVLWGEFSSALLERGWLVRSEPGGRLRSVARGSPPSEVGWVDRWEPPRTVTIAWGRPQTGAPTRPALTIRCAPDGADTTILVEHRGGEHLRGAPQEEQRLGWLTTEVFAPLLLAVAPAQLAAWSYDRGGRRPSGPTSRANYREPIYHLPGFHAILEGLALGKEDRLLEVGCGGGALLRRALRTGCRAAAIDHSAAQLKVAAQQNARALAAGHLELRYGDAGALPFPSGRFTCAVMSGVLPWLPDPVQAFREVHRTLRPGGRFVAWTGTPRMYGTPAAGPRVRGGPRLYSDRALLSFARQAGFSEYRVDHPDLRRVAAASGVPKAARFLFGPDYGSLLWARKGERLASGTGVAGVEPAGSRQAVRSRRARGDSNP